MKTDKAILMDLLTKVDASFVIRAINAHDGLVKACQIAMEAHHNSHDGEICDENKLCLYCKVLAEAGE